MIFLLPENAASQSVPVPDHSNIQILDGKIAIMYNYNYYQGFRKKPLEFRTRKIEESNNVSARYKYLQNRNIKQYDQLLREFYILFFVWQQLLQQYLLFIFSYINRTSIAHHQIPAFTFDVFFNFIEVDQIGAVNTDKGMLFQRFFYFF